MVAFLTSAETLNLTELCGVLRFALKLKPGCKNQLADAIVVLRLLVRIDAASFAEPQVKVMVDWADGVLCSQLKAVMNAKNDIMEWASDNLDLLGLVLDKAKMQKVLSCDKEWTSVPKEPLL